MLYKLTGVFLCLTHISVSAFSFQSSNCLLSPKRLHPDPEDCQKFIRCVNGKEVIFHCPPLTAFDPATQVCAWRVRKNGCGGRLPLGTVSWNSILGRFMNSVDIKSSPFMNKVEKVKSSRTKGKFFDNKLDAVKDNLETSTKTVEKTIVPEDEKTSKSFASAEKTINRVSDFYPEFSMHPVQNGFHESQHKFFKEDDKPTTESDERQTVTLSYIRRHSGSTIIHPSRTINGDTFIDSTAETTSAEVKADQTTASEKMFKNDHLSVLNQNDADLLDESTWVSNWDATAVPYDETTQGVLPLTGEGLKSSSTKASSWTTSQQDIEKSNISKERNEKKSQNDTSPIFVAPTIGLSDTEFNQTSEPILTDYYTTLDDTGDKPKTEKMKEIDISLGDLEEVNDKYVTITEETPDKVRSTTQSKIVEKIVNPSNLWRPYLNSIKNDLFWNLENNEKSIRSTGMSYKTDHPSTLKTDLFTFPPNVQIQPFRAKLPLRKQKPPTKLSKFKASHPDRKSLPSSDSKIFLARIPEGKSEHKTFEGGSNVAKQVMSIGERFEMTDEKHNRMEHEDLSTEVPKLPQEKNVPDKDMMQNKKRKPQNKQKPDTDKSSKRTQRSRKRHSTENDENKANIRRIRSSEEDTSVFSTEYERNSGGIQSDDLTQSKSLHHNYHILTASLKSELLDAEGGNAVELPNRVQTGRWYEKYTLPKKPNLFKRRRFAEEWFDKTYVPNAVPEIDVRSYMENVLKSQNLINHVDLNGNSFRKSQDVKTDSKEADNTQVEKSDTERNDLNATITLTDNNGDMGNIAAEDKWTNATEIPHALSSNQSETPEATKPTTIAAKPTSPSFLASGDMDTKVIGFQAALEKPRASAFRTSFWGGSNDEDLKADTKSEISRKAADLQHVDFKSTPHMAQGRPFECPRPNGHFPDPKDCAIFYHCEEGFPYRRDCPPGEVFHSEVLSCVSKSLAGPCEQSHRSEEADIAWRPACDDANGLYRDPNSCLHFYECTDGWPVRRECMTGTVFDEQQGKCTWSQFVPGCEDVQMEVDEQKRTTFLCPRDGYFRDTERCDVYYLCAGPDSIRMQCTTGTSFDLTLNMCVWSDLVPGCEHGPYRHDVLDEPNFIPNVVDVGKPAEDEISHNSDFICPESDGFYAHPHNCNLYISCMQNTATLMNCPYGSGYDTNTGLCLDMLQLPRCASSEIHPGTQEQVTVQTNFVFECPADHGLYPDPSNCSVFIHCFKGKPYRHQCQEGTLYSSEVAACTWAHFVPECQGDKPIVSPAQGGTMFNSPGQSEGFVGVPYKYDDYETADYADNRDRSLYRFTDFQCDSVVDGFHRDNVFCDIFHRCVLGTKYTFTCSDGTFFRVGMSICDFWDTVTDCTPDGVRFQALGSLPQVAPASESQSGRTPVSLPLPERPVSVETGDPSFDEFDFEPVPCPESSGLFPHPRNCRQFIFCAQYVPLKLTCPRTLLYNPLTLTCDYAANVRCLRYDILKK